MKVSKVMLPCIHNVYGLERVLAFIVMNLSILIPRFESITLFLCLSSIFSTHKKEELLQWTRRQCYKKIDINFHLSSSRREFHLIIVDIGLVRSELIVDAFLLELSLRSLLCALEMEEEEDCNECDQDVA